MKSGRRRDGRRHKSQTVLERPRDERYKMAASRWFMDLLRLLINQFILSGATAPERITHLLKGRASRTLARRKTRTRDHQRSSVFISWWKRSLDAHRPPLAEQHKQNPPLAEQLPHPIEQTHVLLLQAKTPELGAVPLGAGQPVHALLRKPPPLRL